MRLKFDATVKQNQDPAQSLGLVQVDIQKIFFLLIAFLELWFSIQEHISHQSMLVVLVLAVL